MFSGKHEFTVTQVRRELKGFSRKPRKKQFQRLSKFCVLQRRDGKLLYLHLHFALGVRLQKKDQPLWSGGKGTFYEKLEFCFILFEATRYVADLQPQKRQTIQNAGKNF